MKKIIALVASAALMSCLFLVGCGGGSASAPSDSSSKAASSEKAPEKAAEKAPAGDVEMKYVSVADAKKLVGDDAYLFVDLRKAADYDAGHIDGAVSADMDPIVSNQDNATATENMKEALKKATGSEKGGDKQLVLVCYSGKKYAQAGTNVLSELGANMDNVKTLEGGMKAWGA